jgi:hypothetical protein
MEEETVVEVRFKTREEANAFQEAVTYIHANGTEEGFSILGQGSMTVKSYYPNYWMKDLAELFVLRVKGWISKLASFATQTLL